MGDVVNLRLARKAKARTDREATAAANRAQFGQTKGDKARLDQQRARAAALLDGARRDHADPDDGNR